MTRIAERIVVLYVWMAAFVLIAPIGIVVVLAFSGQGYLAFPPRSFSLRWFAAFLGSPQWRASLGVSLIIGLIACFIATVLGFLTAYAMVRSAMPAKRALLAVLLLPMIVPTIITAIALYFVSAALHLVGSIIWIGCCHAAIGLPVVVLILISTLQGIDRNLEWAGLSCGASRLRVFLRVVVPLAAPGMASAALFGFLASFDELLIALFLSGIRMQTLPVRIWNSLSLNVEPTIAAVSACLIGLTAVILLLSTALRGRVPLPRRGEG